MELLTVVLAVLLGCGLLLALAVMLISWWLEEAYGALATKALLAYAVPRVVGLILVVGALLVIAVLAVPPADWQSLTLVIAVSGLAGLWGLAYLWIRDRRSSGQVLLDMGNTAPASKRWAAGIAGFGGLLILAALVDGDMVWFIYGLYFLSLAVGQYHHDSARLTMTQKGIYAPEGSVHWDDMIAARWLDGTHEVSILLVKTRRVIFHTQAIRIPWSYLEEVEEIIVDCVPEGVFQETSVLERS